MLQRRPMWLWLRCCCCCCFCSCSCCRCPLAAHRPWYYHECFSFRVRVRDAFIRSSRSLIVSEIWYILALACWSFACCCCYYAIFVCQPSLSVISDITGQHHLTISSTDISHLATPAQQYTCRYVYVCVGMCACRFVAGIKSEFRCRWLYIVGGNNKSAL